jgi:hypothetical protein
LRVGKRERDGFVRKEPERGAGAALGVDEREPGRTVVKNDQSEPRCAAVVLKHELRRTVLTEAEDAADTTLVVSEGEAVRLDNILYGRAAPNDDNGRGSGREEHRQADEQSSACATQVVVFLLHLLKALHQIRTGVTRLIFCGIDFRHWSSTW